MNRDFTGREAPYGGRKLQEDLIGDYNNWVFCAYIPHSAYEIGTETITKKEWCDIKLEHVTTIKTIPLFGHCSWYDFDREYIYDLSNAEISNLM